MVVGIGGLKDQVARQTLEMASVSSTSRAERAVKSLCRECPTTAKNPKIHAMTPSFKTTFMHSMLLQRQIYATELAP